MTMRPAAPEGVHPCGSFVGVVEGAEGSGLGYVISAARRGDITVSPGTPGCRHLHDREPVRREPCRLVAAGEPEQVVLDHLERAHELERRAVGDERAGPERFLDPTFVTPEALAP